MATLLSATPAVDLSGVTLPFSVGDLAATGMDLLGLVGPYVLLALAFIFAPKIIALVKGAFTRGKA